MPPIPYEVFLSYKNTVHGIPTEDSRMARQLFDCLKEAGIRVFLSEVSLKDMGADRYKESIDEILDDCSVLIVVGTSLENIQSSWVKYEWNSFFNDILMERKQGRMFSYIDGITSRDLPRTLRNLQCFERRSTTLADVLTYVQHALSSVREQRRSGAGTGRAPQAESDANSSIQKLLQFANLISCGDATGQYVNPYVSEEMADLAARTVDTLKPFDTGTCIAEHLNPVLYEVFLAQKIARINRPESCAKSFQLLHHVTNCWKVFLNGENKVVAYWTFIALKEDSYARISTGQINEMDISLDDVRFIGMPGRYKGYLLISGAIEQCRTPRIERAVYSSWLDSLQTFAENEIFFDEISSMVGSAAGNSALQNIGMTYYADYRFGGRMYRYDLRHVEQIPYLKRYYPRMTELYRNEYGGGEQE